MSAGVLRVISSMRPPRKLYRRHMVSRFVVMWGKGMMRLNNRGDMKNERIQTYVEKAMTSNDAQPP